MSDLIKKPYEISVWIDEQWYSYRDNGVIVESTTLPSSSVDILNDYLKEIKVATIGADNFKSPINVTNPQFVTNINGSHTLSFSMPTHYYTDEGDFLPNPWLNYLINERKIKLKYDGKWYEFLIKDISEDPFNYTNSYTCTDLFIEELSKTGYSIELDTELENNMGTAQELAATVLEGTDWRVDPNSDVIKQTTEEALFVCSISTGFTANAVTDYEYDGEEWTSGQSVSIPANTTVYVSYNSVINNDNNVVFFWSPNKYIVDDEGIILNSPNWIATKNAVLNGKTMYNMAISQNYRGRTAVSQQKKKYIPLIDEYCDVYTKNGDTYYSYNENVYLSGVNLQQLITNNVSFISTKGWSTTGGATVGLGSNAGTLNIGFTSGGKVINSGIYDNRQLFTDGFVTGTKYVLLLKKSGGTIGSIYVEGEKADHTVTNFFSFSSDSSISVSGYTAYSGTVSNAASHDELINDYLRLDFIMTGSGTMTLTDVKMFEYARNHNGELVIPDLESALEDNVVTKKYYLIAENRLTGVTDANRLKYNAIGSESILNGYTPVSNNYEKVSSITGSKSNRFNLLQNISESFQCWIQFNIDHDENGNVTFAYVHPTETTAISGKKYYQLLGGDPLLDKNYQLVSEPTSVQNYYEKQYGKLVSIKNYITIENYAGFRYGINLKSIQRKLDSNALVTKLIVNSNNNEFARDGFCSIQTSVLNPTGENSLLNFNYYINHDLIDKSALYRDLYDNANSGGIGYYTKLKSINDNNIANIALEVELGNTLNKALARQQAVNALVESAQSKYNDLLNYIREANSTITNPATVTESTSYTDVVNGYIRERNRQTSYINNYKSVQAEIDSLVDLYTQKYNTVLEDLKDAEKKKLAIEKEFFTKYSRYIKEGTWLDESYIDPELYYLDAMGVLYNSTFPKVSYTINVLELSQLEDYKGYTFNVGDLTYIEDTEFFGYNQDTKTPYHERIVVTEVKYSLDDPSANTIQVQNYTSNFEDLFQRMTAATQSLQYAAGAYTRAANAINNDNTLNKALLEKSLAENAAIISNATDQSVVWDNTGITVKSLVETNDIVRLVSGGIVLSNDGGKTWHTGITGSGINADEITTGVLNTGLIKIYSEGTPAFVWNEDGLYAYKHDDGVVSDSEYVLFDQNGIKGISNGSDVFALTYKGFDLNAIHNSNYVKISAEGSNVTVDGVNKTRILWAGNGSTDKFRLYSDGSIMAQDGIFKGTIQADSGYFHGDISGASGTFTGVVNASDYRINGQSILNSAGTKITDDYLELEGVDIVGASQPGGPYVNVHSGSNYVKVSSTGITLNGTIKFEGGTSFTQTQYIKSDTKPAAGTTGSNWDPTWSGDTTAMVWARYSYNAGSTWTDYVLVQGKNGERGPRGYDGEDGKDADLDDVYEALKTEFGMVSKNSSTSLGQSYIYSPHIYGEYIYIGSSKTDNSSAIAMDSNEFAMYENGIKKVYFNYDSNTSNPSVSMTLGNTNEGFFEKVWSSSYHNYIRWGVNDNYLCISDTLGVYGTDSPVGRNAPEGTIYFQII